MLPARSTISEENLEESGVRSLVKTLKIVEILEIIYRNFDSVKE